jgi:hypothetical protein
MKKIIYLGVILMFCSCECSEHENVRELKIAMVKLRQIVTPVKAYKDGKIVDIGGLEVMTEDLGVMNWEDAKRACADLGSRWRLPTKRELNILYFNQVEIGGFSNNVYSGSSENKKGDKTVFSCQDFQDGRQYDICSKLAMLHVRAVRGSQSIGNMSDFYTP